MANFNLPKNLYFSFFGNDLALASQPATGSSPLSLRFYSLSSLLSAEFALFFFRAQHREKMFWKSKGKKKPEGLFLSFFFLLFFPPFSDSFILISFSLPKKILSLFLGLNLILSRLFQVSNSIQTRFSFFLFFFFFFHFSLNRRYF